MGDDALPKELEYAIWLHGNEWASRDAKRQRIASATLSRAILSALRAAAPDAALAETERARDAARDSLRSLLGFIEDGTLVRDVRRDGEPGWSLRMMELVLALGAAQTAAGGAP